MTKDEQRNQFLTALSGLGGKAGNITLREALDWSADEYDVVRDALLEEGAIQKGRGRGGSVFMTGREQEAKAKEAPKGTAPKKNGANAVKKNDEAALGIEAELFKTADKLRGNMEPSDYKHVVLCKVPVN